MTASRSDSDYAALETPLQAGINAQASSVDPSDLDTNIAPVETHAEIPSAAVKTRVLIRYVRVPEPLRARPSTTAAGFKPVVITYDRTGALAETSAKVTPPRSTPRTETPSDDKRSLIAKVVTKPFDWLKAVGSKLR